MLQVVFEVLISFKGCYEMCLMSFWQESMKGMRVGTQSAEVTLFGQFEGDFGNERVLGMVGSCSSL